jgi:hypothetical protein
MPAVSSLPSSAKSSSLSSMRYAMIKARHTRHGAFYRF